MRRRQVITAVAAVGGVVLTGAAARALFPRVQAQPGTQMKLPPATAQVTRQTLVETKTLTGTLGYGEPVPVAAVGAGTLTWIAQPGSTVQRGRPLFKVDQLPVVALYGSVPMYRTVRDGAKGEDVTQLEDNLSAMGYRGFTADDTFTSGTAAAVRDWQATLGLPATGAVEPAHVVFTPGPVRIAAHSARSPINTRRRNRCSARRGGHGGLCHVARLADRHTGMGGHGRCDRRGFPRCARRALPGRPRGASGPH